MITHEETECKSPQTKIKRSDLSKISLRIAKEMPNSKIKTKELRRLDDLAADQADASLPESKMTFSKKGFYRKGMSFCTSEIRESIFYQIAASNMQHGIYMPLCCEDCNAVLWTCEDEEGIFHQCLVIDSETGLFTKNCEMAEETGELYDFICDLTVLAEKLLEKYVSAEKLKNEISYLREHIDTVQKVSKQYFHGYGDACTEILSIINDMVD